MTLKSTVTAIVLLSSASGAALAVTPGPTSLPYSGTVDFVHCGTAACQMHVVDFPLSNGWVGIEIKPSDIGVRTESTKIMKWSTVLSSRGHQVFFSITDLMSTVPCNPDVCGVSAIAELQDIAE